MKTNGTAKDAATVIDGSLRRLQAAVEVDTTEANALAARALAPWECIGCGFTCDDSGPDVCPHDGIAMTRLLGTFRLR